MKTNSSLKSLGALAVSLLVCAGGVLAAAYFRPMPVESDPQLLAASDYRSPRLDRDYISFVPEGDTKKVGLVFYPGARVPPEAYAYLGSALAQSGYPVIIVRFPLNFAVFSPRKALTLLAERTETTQWAIAGHSLGGAMAASLVHAKPELFRGLILLAAWSAERRSLRDYPKPVLSIYGEMDGLATEDEIDRTKGYLPPETEFVRIEGGNHAQFGEYGKQKGDGLPGITAKSQRAIVLKEVLEFMESLSEE